MISERYNQNQSFILKYKENNRLIFYGTKELSEKPEIASEYQHSWKLANFTITNHFCHCMTIFCSFTTVYFEAVEGATLKSS